MTQEEIFEFLRENLMLDYDHSWDSNDLKIKLMLRNPENGENVELGYAYVKQPDTSRSYY